MTATEGAALLDLARTAIADHLFATVTLAQRLRSLPGSTALDERRGVFVTLKVPELPGGLRLRGCIGSIEGEAPLKEGVVDAAVAAAFRDPRFDPLAKHEYALVHLSVSALTPLAPVASAEAIVAGEHGVVLESGRHRAVFLPEVAAEQGWTARTLLEQLSRKAGLPADAWRAARLFVFRSEHFEEARRPW